MTNIASAVRAAIALIFIGCATTTQDRMHHHEEQLKSAKKVLPKIAVGSADWAELTFQTSLLESELADMTKNDAEAADQLRYEATRRLDSLIETTPSYAKLNEALVKRADLAMQRERYSEAVAAFQRALTLGVAPHNEPFVRATFPRALRLAGDCSTALAQPIGTGRVGVNVRVQRAECLASDPAARCTELLAGADEAADAGFIKSYARDLQRLDGVPEECRARLPAVSRSADAGNEELRETQ